MSEIGVAAICEIFRGALQVLRVDLLEHVRDPGRLVFTIVAFRTHSFSVRAGLAVKNV
jgi:hypothetical protein